ncbi:3-hydroxybutyrate dehydrogenase type 2 [Solea senegalensis]|uniref:D-arabinitol 2-dehydrogenase [ribulose-forming] n=1 Tax=Solea senegalensis TaxID=28829 RepID=A0AAV6QJY4_SOLSE|nr:3-hydroxybutyrate dehydrogenase type 2 [Solea senegalensis]
MPAEKVPDTPMEVLVDLLTKANKLAASSGNVPEELKGHLQKALDVASGMDDYLEKMTTQESEPLAELYKKTISHDWDEVYKEGKTMYRLPKECITGHVEGQTLKMLIHMSQAKAVLEIGMFTGYGALSMAEGLPEDGHLVACELEPYLKEFAQPIFDKSPHGRKITVKTGSAMDIIKELAAAGEQFDLVFIDADKSNYINYYNFILDNNLLRLRGVMCVDNSLFKAKVYLKDTTDNNGLALREFNQFVTDDPRVEQVIIPLRDGISVIRRVSVTPKDSKSQSKVNKDKVFCGVNGRSILDRMRLDGQVAYVTGAGQGIGRAFAHALGEAGAKVAVVDLDKEKAEVVAEELLLKGIIAISITADISKSDDIQKMIDTIVSKWGAIHIACNNAGINMNSASEDTTLEEWDQTFNVNLRGTFMCCQAAGRVMLKQGYGKIINTASMASLIVPHPQKQLSYNTSKAGVVKLTQTLGTEWMDRGVRVNCISPGIVDTPLIHSESLRPLVQRWLSDIPAGRLAQVTDLQAAVVYLASDASDYMTGHNLVIEGRFLILPLRGSIKTGSHSANTDTKLQEVITLFAIIERN